MSRAHVVGSDHRRHHCCYLLLKRTDCVSGPEGPPNPVLYEMELKGAKDSRAPELSVSSVTRSGISLTFIKAVEVMAFMFY